MRIPVATYRVQFNAEFRFSHVTPVVRHLARLGISHLYASPIFQAREGSTHGYDVTDPNRINPALGSPEEFEELINELRAHGMGLLIDVVPNHMAASPQNAWWVDVLRHGRNSQYSSWFGIDWSEKILLPVLGSYYGTVLENKELQLVDEGGAFWIAYYDWRFPVDPATIPTGVLPEQINGTKGEPSSFDALDALLRAQHYRLAYWRTAPERINYRRFFDVAELVSMRVEQEELFRTAHALVFELVAQGKVDGLRIDHIDGLLNPKRYLERLPQTYTVVEKILAEGEQLPPDWPVQGTTGYDFAGYLNAWYVQPQGLEQLDAFYRQITRCEGTLSDIEYERKKYVMRELFTADIARLSSRLDEIADRDRHWRDLSPLQIHDALVEVTACMPVYRTYTTSFAVSEQDRQAIERAFGEARRRNPDLSPQVYDMLAAVLTLQKENQDWLRFVMLWQQMTGPIMAKGVEDSAFYNYNRLASLNEVGGIPRPVDTPEFHQFLANRPLHTMNASSTHDSKRSEDVRARLNVLPELVQPWQRVVNRILRNKPVAVDSNTAYLLYQALVGAWPLKEDQIADFRERLKNYMRKAAREARVQTNWLDPNEEYEAALLAYVDDLMNDPSLFLPLIEKLAFYGAVNSLSQLLVKAAAPGVPDFYRGTIEWDLSLVDPDNRRPVEFRELTDFGERARDLLEHWQDGCIKIFVTEKLLAFRKSRQQLFESGAYIPLETAGKRSMHAVCFARVGAGGEWVIAVAPRWTASMSASVRMPTGFPAWRDTVTILPDNAPRIWRNVLTGSHFESQDGRLRLSVALSDFPVALLVG